VIVDPRIIGRAPRAADTEPRALTVPEVLALGLELRTLALDLGRWPPVAAGIERVADACAGRDGITVDDVARLRRWAARWAQVAPEVRAFYRAEDPSTRWYGPAVRRVLDGTPVSGVVVGESRRAYAQRYGREAEQQIIPAARPDNGRT